MNTPAPESASDSRPASPPAAAATPLIGADPLALRDDVSGKEVLIRPYRAGDRPAVRELCADTGFLSNPIDPVFQDRELFADYLTAYYTDCEPESSFVCEMDGVVKGYIMGCRHPARQRRYEAWHNALLAVRGAWRYLFVYNKASRKFVRWIIARAPKEVPPAPRDIPHFHINLRPEARNVHTTRYLFDALLTYMRSCGETAIFAQVVGYEKRRGVRMFQRYGFEVLNQSEVTKFRDYTDQSIYLITIRKDLTANETLYGLDLKKAKHDGEAGGGDADMHSAKPLQGNEKAGTAGTSHLLAQLGAAMLSAASA